MSDLSDPGLAATSRLDEEIAALKLEVLELSRMVKEIALREAPTTQKTGATVSGQASNLYDTVSEESRQRIEQVNAYIKVKPMKSLLIAFGAGYIVSKIL